MFDESEKKERQEFAVTRIQVKEAAAGMQKERDYSTEIKNNERGERMKGSIRHRVDLGGRRCILEQRSTDRRDSARRTWRETANRCARAGRVARAGHRSAR